MDKIIWLEIKENNADINLDAQILKIKGKMINLHFHNNADINLIAITDYIWV